MYAVLCCRNEQTFLYKQCNIYSELVAYTTINHFTECGGPFNVAVFKISRM